MTDNSSIRNSFNELAEWEFNERAYGNEFRFERENPFDGGDGPDPIEYGGYNHREGDFNNTDLPWEEYVCYGLDNGTLPSTIPF